MKKDAEYWKLYKTVKSWKPDAVTVESKMIDGQIVHLNERMALVCKCLGIEIIPNVVQVEMTVPVDSIIILHAEPSWPCSDKELENTHVVVRKIDDRVICISGSGWLSMAKERGMKTVRCIHAY